MPCCCYWSRLVDLRIRLPRVGGEVAVLEAHPRLPNPATPSNLSAKYASQKEIIKTDRGVLVWPHHAHLQGEAKVSPTSA